jgi:hypothetical protein
MAMHGEQYALSDAADWCCQLVGGITSLSVSPVMTEATAPARPGIRNSDSRHTPEAPGFAIFFLAPIFGLVDICHDDKRSLIA